MTKTVYDVIDFGVNYIRSVYDDWDVVEVLDKDDSVFPNTLHWQYGHVLTVFEEALSMGNQEVVDVEKYGRLFGTGTKPADWGNEDVPSIESILNDIKTLPERARHLTDKDLEKEVDQPVAGCKTLEEFLVLNALHIPLHAGKIEEMTRVLISAQ
ncbi:MULTISPECIES: bacillithiol transferase BstA [Staphylococcus]|uniref:bacillithiol transferase BstA n=1 Tax=Staphylococcus TaxID=1279 RepID=UPI000CD0C6B3|nr:MULTISPECIES: bacillithiol transferase BstA [Staphylococcus]POA04620.1 damage-inducible protein DinB [Staphylococcus caprae]SUL94379.1 dinB superfamily protein [Staphylococcus caprae]HCG74404.1 damage-inducible protein DinB [Staphylococcus sp.]